MTSSHYQQTTVCVTSDLMKLVVLGSGTSVPHAGRAAAGYWLETESGRALLDISADAPHRMAREELDWVKLDAIWLSHFHLDHIGGLAPFLFGNAFGSPDSATGPAAQHLRPSRLY